jgi:hypothetical protein
MTGTSPRKGSSGSWIGKSDQPHSGTGNRADRARSVPTRPPPMVIAKHAEAEGRAAEGELAVNPMPSSTTLRRRNYGEWSH